MGKIWISVYGSGVFRYNPSDGKIKHYSHDINDEKSLISNLTTKILIDHTGEVWIATHDQGVCKYDPFTDSFFRIDATDKQKGYTARYIYALCEDSFGNIWIGSQDNGISVLNIENHTLVNYAHDSKDLNSLSSNKVFSITETPEGNILVGTIDGGIDSFDFSTRTFTRNFIPMEGMVFTMVTDSKKNLWIGTDGYGLKCYREDNRSVETWICVKQRYIVSWKISKETFGSDYIKREF